jgi:hypothetical protein
MFAANEAMSVVGYIAKVEITDTTTDYRNINDR